MPQELTKQMAVFGDVHGHLRLMFQLCRLYQKEHRVHLDDVLQCGDIGFFPDVSRLDSATRRYAKRDLEEIGFAKYFRLPSPHEKDELLNRILLGPYHKIETVRCPVIWCHGNHEDFVELRKTVGSGARRNMYPNSISRGGLAEPLFGEQLISTKQSANITEERLVHR